MQLNMFDPVINLGSVRWCRKGFDEEPQAALVLARCPSLRAAVGSEPSGWQAHLLENKLTEP